MAKKIITTSIIILFSLLITPSFAFAQGGAGGSISGGGAGGTVETTGSGNANEPVRLENPLGNVRDVPTLIGKIIDALLGLVGSLALIMFIYGGFVWMMAAGNETNVQKGKNILLWAIIGLVVVFSSYSLVHFILKSVAQ